jgi:small GTP-binding protein
MSGEFRDEYDPTIENTYFKSACVEDQMCLLQIIDTAGQEEYAAIGEESIRKADAFMIVYDVSRASSFERIVDYFRLVRQLPKEYSPRRILLVGAMTDLAELRQVSAQRGLEYAEKVGCNFLETSAKLNQNVQKAFHQIVATLPEFGQVEIVGKAPS